MACGILYKNDIDSVFAYVLHASHSGCLHSSASIPCYIYIYMYVCVCRMYMCIYIYETCSDGSVPKNSNQSNQFN